jgi:adenine-specific DNA-methyltransferase
MAKKNKYADWTKEELIKRVTALDKRKKYGLVWDEEKTKEKFEADAEGKFPVLKEVKSKEIKTDLKQPTHILIEGDNYHALSVLSYTHEKKIDVIYIDPPYNTGNKSWKYNNDYVEKDDSYKHSKWLSFMQKRLLLAKRLLNKNGVLVCTIDENEQATLGLLLQEIFPSYQITCVTIVHNPAGIQGDNFSYCHEFAYFVYPRGGRYIGQQLREEGNNDIRNFRDVTGEDSLRTAGANCFYPIYVKDSKIIAFGPVCKNDYHPNVNVKRNDGVIEIYPVDPQGVERKWRFARQTVEKIKDELEVKFIKGRKVYDIIRSKNKFNFKTVWTDSKYSANNHGTQLLNQILEPGSFSFPKSLFAVIDSIKAASNENKKCIVVDFFAGSGTTGHAVLHLNKEDDGQRQFILCTNNENDICTDVCYPRIKKVVKGYSKPNEGVVSGLEGNLKYFKTSFIPQESTDKNKELLTKEATEMLCLRENAFEFVIEQEGYKIYKNDKKYLGIILDQSLIEDFKKEAKKFDKQINVYVFSLTDEDFSEEFTDLKKKVKVCSIPEAILRVYRRIFK